jgi:hypothetical protein
MSTLLLNSITGLTTSTELTGVNLDLYLREYPNLSKVGIATTATSNYFVMLNETNIELRQPVVSNNLTYNPYSGALNVSGSLSGITTLSMSGSITGITSISISGRLYDGSGSYGSSSQILSSTGSAIQWINASTTNVGSATSVAINLDSTNASKYLTFVDTSSGNNLVKVDTDLTYNPSTNVLTATTFSGSLSGTATTTTNIPNLTGDITSANKVTTISVGIITNSHINASAAIAYSKLNLSGSIVNGDIGASAAIAYSKLNLSGSIVNADIGASAAIANSKLANNTISGVSLGSTLATLTFGTYLTGTSYNGSTGITIATNATNANTSSTIVARDASGNFNAGIITATFSGNATTATNISNAGTVTLASATESNSIYITQPSYTTDQPVKLLNFDWYGNLWSLGNIRSGSTPSSGFGVYSSGTERARFTTNGLTTILINYAETINAVGNTGTAATINLANGNFVTATLTGNCTFTFTTGISTGAVSFTLFLTNDATPSRVITWPASVKWPGGTVSTRTTTASRTDVYTFFTLNNGTDWYGNIAQYNYA